MKKDFDENNLCNLEHLLNLGITKQKWLIKELIPIKAIINLCGISGIGKSLLVSYFSLCSVSNKKVFDEFEIERKINVLLLDVENRKEGLSLRFKLIIEGNNLNLPEDYLFFIKYGENLNLDENLIEELEQIINIYNINLIVFDSLIRFIDGDENSSKDVKKVFEFLNPLVNKYELSIILLHHTIKSPNNTLSDLRGSGDFSASVDIVYLLFKKKNRIILSQVKNRNAELINKIAYNMISKFENDINTSIKFVRDNNYLDKSDDDFSTKIIECAILWIKNEKNETFKSSKLNIFLEEKFKKKKLFYEIKKELLDLKIIKLVKNGVYTKLK